MSATVSKVEEEEWKAGLSTVQLEKIVSLESSLAAATSKLSDQQLLISDLRKMTGGEDVVKELRKIEELEMELGEKEDQTRDLEVKLFEVSFTSADPDLSSTTTSPPPSSSLLPSQPPVAEGSIDFGLLPSTKPSTIMSSSILQTPGDSRRNTISTLHGSGLPKPGTSRLPFRPSALPTPGTGNKTRPDQTSSGIAGVFGPAKFGFGVGRQSLGIKSSKVSPPSVGGGKAAMGAKTGEVKMAKLELGIKEKTAEVGRLNIKLNAAKEKCSQMDMMKVDLEREREKAANLSTRLTSLQSDTRCQMSNAEAARMILEKKMKEQEVDLKTENSRKASEIVTLTKEMEAAKGDLKKIREEARQQAEQLGKLQINKSGMEKENFKMKVEMDDLKTHLDLISAEAEELNQTVINVREEKNKLSADKAALENGIEGSRLAVVKLQAEVNGVRQELNITKSENEALKDNSKSRDELVVRSQEEYTELRSDSAKALELEKLASQKKVGEISLIVDSKIAELSSLSAELDQVKKELSRMMEGSSGQNIELEEKEKLCRALQEELEKLKNESMKIQYSEARLIEDLKAAVEQSKVQHLDDEMKIKYTEEKLIKAESEVICKDVLLGEMVCQLGAASDNESVWNENVEKLRGDYEALQEQLVLEESIQKAAIETLEEKVLKLGRGKPQTSEEKSGF